MSTSYSTSQTPDDANPSTSDPAAPSAKKEPLALPEVPYNERITTLDMSNGDTSIALDHLGPMVVNVDGTLSRISNWDNMADIEKKNTLRIIGKRNQSRLKVLREAEAQKGEGSGH